MKENVSGCFFSEHSVLWREQKLSINSLQEAKMSDLDLCLEVV